MGDGWPSVDVSCLGSAYLGKGCEHQGPGLFAPLSSALDLLAEGTCCSSKLSHRRAVPRARLRRRRACGEHRRTFGCTTQPCILLLLSFSFLSV